MSMAEPLRSSPPASRRVLVVDDDRNFADGVVNLLTLEDYDVRTAYDAAQAVEAVAAFDAQAAILDYRLGPTIGVDLIAPLTEYRPGIVCILLTAYEDVDMVVSALRSGAYDYIRKPVHADELLTTLDRCFERRRLLEANAAAEEALREAKKMEAVAQIAGGVAHHFNNAFAAICTGVELLQDDPGASADGKKLTDRILNTVMRAADINKSLVAYARRQALRPITFDLGDHLERHVSDLRREHGDSVTIALAMADDLASARLDREQLGVAIEHLVSNAVNAMPEGGKVSIDVAGIDVAGGDPAPIGELPRGRYVAITVSDTGTGIPPDIKERVFEPFFSGKGLAESAGLGLSMVYGFAKQSGGDVSIESEPGKGTTVRLHLPRHPDE
jgi:signal transduction histidine kinase